MQDTGRVYDFTSSFPTRFSTVFSAVDAFMKNEEWSSYMDSLGEAYEKGENKLVRPIMALGAVSVTGIIGLFALALLQYTFQVILTLAVIESPPTIALPIDSKRKPKPVRVLGMDTPTTYFTSTLCGTISNLRNSAGWFAAWRGWNVHVAYMIALIITRRFLKGVMGNEGFSRPLAGLGSLIVLGQFAMVCTHIIIARPQKMSWFSIMISTPWSTASHSIPAMVPFALAQTLAAELCNYGANQNIHHCTKMALFMSGVLVSVFITFPCMVALIRVQASLLSDGQDAVVSFDRNFGITDGTAVIGFKQALKSVGWAGWKRIYGITIKATIILAGLSVVEGIVVGLGMTWATGHPISAAEGRQSLTLMALISVLEFFGTLR